MSRRRLKAAIRMLWITMAGAVGASAALYLSGCGRQSSTREQSLLLAADGCRIYADSMVFDNGMTIRVADDSLLQVRLDGITLRQMRMAPVDARALSVRSTFPLLDAFLRLENSSGRPRLCADALLWGIALNPLASDEDAEALDARLSNGFPVPSEAAGYSWPMVNSNPVWLLAAAESAKCSGSLRRLTSLSTVAPGIVAEDARVCLNASTGLLYGLPHYLAGNQSMFPEWMQPVDRFECQTFGVNMSYVLALRSLDELNRSLLLRNRSAAVEIDCLVADSLCNALKRRMWLPQQGCFGAMAYGFPVWPVALEGSDSFMQAMAVAFGCIDGAMARSMVNSFPLPDGLPSIPQHTGAAAAIAAARVHSSDQMSVYVAAIMKRIGLEILSGRKESISVRALSAVVLRGLLGCRFGWYELTFAPYLPPWLREAHINFGWRKADVEVSLSGAGANAVVAGGGVLAVGHSAEGKVSVDITLTPEDGLPGFGKVGRRGEESRRVPMASSLPKPPIVEWQSATRATVAAATDADVSQGAFEVWVNGVLNRIADRRIIELDNLPGFCTVQIASVDSAGCAGFSAMPHEIDSRSNVSLVRLATVAKGGTKVLPDKHLAARFVESSRAANRNLRFNGIAPEGGRYIVDVHYASGLGIVNPRRGTALRMCMVNGRRAGVFVFPQFSPSAWDKSLGDDWQRLSSFSNPLVVKLEAGENSLELRYFQTSPVYLDPTANSLVADYVRLIPL